MCLYRKGTGQVTLAGYDGNGAVSRKQHTQHTQRFLCVGSDALSILKGH